MKTVREVMTRHVVTVPPTAIAKTAAILMKGHEIGALPVVQNHEALVGIVYYHDVLGQNPETPVSEIMSKEFITVVPDTTVFDAAERMTKNGHSHLLVVEEGELVGIMSHSDALKELGTSFDPLTGLPWSDALRDWATSALKRGQEIAVILLDLNQFGLFNKKYGHVMGDGVLKAVSEALKTTVDPDLDFLCRYAGDEFSVASVRRAEEAIELGERLVERIAELQFSDMPEGVTAAFGIAGGRRTKERLDVHYAATLDDLINRASQDCMRNKPGHVEAPSAQPQTAVEPTGAATGTVERPRLKLDRINISSSGGEAEVEVILSRGGQSFAMSASGYAVATRNVGRLVAEAAAAAVTSSLAPGYGVIVDDLVMQSAGSGNEIVTVLAVFLTPSTSTMHAGSAVVRHTDLYRAAASALLSAVNRRAQSAPPASVASTEE